MNNLGVTLVIAIGFKLRFESTVFNIFGAKEQITNSRAESKRTPKDFLTSVKCKRLARVLIISRTLLGTVLFFRSSLSYNLHLFI